MKTHLYVTFFLVFCCHAFAKAQTTKGIRVGYVDMEYILESVPEYQQASQELETKMQKWKREMEAMDLEIKQMKDALQNEKVLLTKELIEEKQEEITLKQDDLAAYQQKRFAAGTGDYFVQKVQLVQPVEDQVFNEIQKIADQKRYDYIIDATEQNLLYGAERHDLSDEILKAIGRTGKAKEREETRAKRNQPVAKEEQYLSVEEAEVVQDKVEAKKAIIDERTAIRQDKISKNDSLRAAKAKEYQDRRQKLIETRDRKRDSILEVRARLKAEREKPKSGN